MLDSNGALIGNLNGATLVVGKTYIAQAVPTSDSGPISKVEFYWGANLVQTDTVAPYQRVWTVSSPGTLTVKAIPYDGAGKAGTSLTVTATNVAATPTPSPSPTGTPSPSPSPTATATATASPSASPTPGSVTVNVVNPTAGDNYSIYYGKQPGNYGSPVPIPSGQSSVRIGGLSGGTTYYFACITTRGGMASVMSDPVSYTTAAIKQMSWVPLIVLFVLLAALLIFVFQRNR